MTVRERLEEVFRTVFNDDGMTLTDETTADDIAGWDSVAHIALMFSVEQAFGVRFSGDEFAELATVGDLRRALELRAGLAPRPG